MITDMYLVSCSGRWVYLSSQFPVRRGGRGLVRGHGLTLGRDHSRDVGNGCSHHHGTLEGEGRGGWYRVTVTVVT